MKILVTLSLLVFFSMASYSQRGIQKFLVAEYRIDSPKNGNYAYLTTYNFKNGKFTGKDTLLQKPRSREEDKAFRVTYSGTDQVYQKRYLLTKYGCIIDLKAGKIRYKTGDLFVEALGDTLIYSCSDSLRGKGYWALNLGTGSYARIEKDTWYKPRYNTSSPNNKYYLTVDRSDIRYKLCLNDHAGNMRVLVKDAKAGPESRNITQWPGIESYWLNNNEFLYVVHHRIRPSKDVLYHKADFRKYNLKDSSDHLQFTLDSIPQGTRNGFFSKNKDGEVVYRASSSVLYLLDTIELRLSEIKVHKAGYGFSATYSEKGTALKYKGAAIETKQIREYRTAGGIVAAKYGTGISDPGELQGVMFWSAGSKKWIYFDIPWIDTIIGWYEE